MERKTKQRNKTKASEDEPREEKKRLLKQIKFEKAPKDVQFTPLENPRSNEDYLEICDRIRDIYCNGNSRTLLFPYLRMIREIRERSYTQLMNASYLLVTSEPRTRFSLRESTDRLFARYLAHKHSSSFPEI